MLEIDAFVRGTMYYFKLNLCAAENVQENSNELVG